MNIFCSCLHLTKIAEEASMRLGEEQSPNSKFCSIWPNVHNSDRRRSSRARFFLLTLCTSCTWLPLLGVLPRQRSGFSVALLWWGSVAAMGYRQLPCMSKGLLQFKADPTLALRGSCPSLHITDKKGGSEESGSSRRQSRRKTHVCLVPELVLLQLYHPLCDFASTCFSRQNFFSSTGVRKSGFKELTHSLAKRKDE